MSGIKISRPYIYALLFIGIPIVSMLMHWNIFTMPPLGVHAWRQTQTQTNIRLFYEEDMNILNPRVYHLDFGDEQGIYRREFPLMQWSVALLYKVFGESIAISRAVNFLIGCLGIWGFFFLIRNIFRDDMIALLSAWAITFSPELFFYMINPMPDTLALSSGIWALALFVGWTRSRKPILLLFSGISICLSILTKLPFIVYLPIPFIYLFLTFFKKERKLSIKSWLHVALTLLTLIPAFLWYAWVIPQWGNEGITGGILHDAEFTGHDYYLFIRGTLISMIPELFLNYASVPLFLAGIFFSIKKRLYKSSLFLPFLVGFLTVVAYWIFELNMINLVHDYYLFPFIPLLFLFIAIGIRFLYQLRKIFPKVILVVLLICMPVLAFLRASSRWQEENYGVNQDLLTHQEDIRAILPANAKVLVGDDISPHTSLYFIERYGWSFVTDLFDTERLQFRVNQGATHLCIDNRKFDQDPTIRPFIGQEKGRFGSVRIYELVQPEINK